jgi:heme-degrading monooxygenase HmoA
MTAPAGSAFAALPPGPCWAVIFSSQRGAEDAEGYARTADAMVELARQQPGYLGVESARGADGFGITVSYWASEDAIRAWKEVVAHRAAQRMGRERWYRHYELRVARVERAYSRETSPRDGL